VASIDAALQAVAKEVERIVNPQPTDTQVEKLSNFWEPVDIGQRAVATNEEPQPFAFPAHARVSFALALTVRDVHNRMPHEPE
jgi:hypothetical protein